MMRSLRAVATRPMLWWWSASPPHCTVVNGGRLAVGDEVALEG